MASSTETIPRKYPKQRPGTSGILGKFYETKLASLIYFRAIHDDRIEEFHLDTFQIGGMLLFRDICFRAKFRGIDKALTVFIQAKHREDNNSILTFNISDLKKYFDHYLYIRTRFKPNNEDLLFDSETECLFVIYTTAKLEFNNTYTGNFAEHLNALIGTGDPGSRPSLELIHEKLCKLVMEKQITALACTMAKCILQKFHKVIVGKYNHLMQDELVLRYHVILGQKVFDISEIQPEGHRNASFRKEFFNIDEEYLQLFKHELITEVLKRSVNLTRITEESLPLLEFKVPASFGNNDLTINGSDYEIERKLKDLTSRIVGLIEQLKPSNIVTIDESMGKEFLELSGGIASAVGNLLVFDDDSKLMKFNENYESLGKLAKKLFDKLNGKIDNLNKYKFDVLVKIFPKLSFTTDNYIKKNVSEFLNSLLFYTSQSNEKEVEETLIYEIMNSQGVDVQHVDVTSDAIFLKYHDEIREWRIESSYVGIDIYLDKEGSLYKNVVKHTARQPLLSIINMMQEIKNKSYAFRENTVNSIKCHHTLLNLQYFLLPSGTVIVTDNRVLTVAKLTNVLNNNDYIVLDLEYILNLSARDDEILRRELIDTNKVKTVIVVFDKALIAKTSSNKLENIVSSIKEKIVIIITDQNSVENAKKYFTLTGEIININVEMKLIDMCKISQKIILWNTKVVFQGNKVRLNEILDENMIRYVEGDVLNKLMHNSKNIIGKPISNSNYNPKLYIRGTIRGIELKTQQHLFRSGRNCFETLEDFLINDYHALIIGDPGIGKSTLLTQLSLKTTKLKWRSHREWILRINLLEYSQEFSEWQKKKTDINTLESVKFLCKVALSEESSKTNNLNITLKESKGTVYLKDCTGDEWTVFELNMFLTCMWHRQTFILLDGFDEICPTYVNEVLALIKALKNRPHFKMLITSRSFEKINSILELQHFVLYKIEPLNTREQYFYLNSFWEEKEILKDLNDDHFKNIYDYITFMSSVDLKELLKQRDLPIESNKEIPFLRVFFSLIKYLKYNLTIAPSSVMNALNELFDECYGNSIFQNQSVAIPLYLNIIADYLYNKIKEINIKPNNWDLATNIFHIYEDFMVTKLKRIRLHEKNQNDMSKQDNNISAYEREYADFKVMHRKLAAYAVFDKCLFNENESKQFEEMIYKLKEGEERTGIICDVVNGIPIFVHSTFAEYFAVEYICDLLKSNENQNSLWDFILNVMFFNCNFNVLDAFDDKIKIDEDMPLLFEKNKKLIFDVLLKQGKNTENKHGTIKSSLCEAIRNDLPNIGLLLLSTIGDNLDESNLMDFIKIVRETNMLVIAVKMEFEALIASIVNHVKVVDKSKLILLFEDFDLNENIDNVSTDELVNKLHRYVWSRAKLSRK